MCDQGHAEADGPWPKQTRVSSGVVGYCTRTVVLL